MTTHLPSDTPLTLRAHGTDLTIEPQAGCVATSWRLGTRELLALPAPREAFLKSARTGGIPLLYPYANRLRTDRFTAAGREVNLSLQPDLKRDGNGLPIHGLLLRWNQWSVERLGDSSARASIAWAEHASLMRAFPFKHTLRVMWELAAIDGGASLRVTTEIDADGGMDVPAAFGWHPYFAITNPANAQVHMPSRRPMTLDANGVPNLPMQPGSTVAAQAMPACGGEDALFALDAATPVTARITQSDLDTSITFDNPYAFMQLYAPKVAPNAAGFACIEPMLCATSALSDGNAPVVRAGTTLQAVFEIRATAAVVP